MSAVKRALETALIEIVTGDEGKPVIKIATLDGEVTIYESLVDPGQLIVEVDDHHLKEDDDEPMGEAFPGVDRIRAVPGVTLYHNDGNVWDWSAPDASEVALRRIQPCEYELDGYDTDRTPWYRCTTHDELEISDSVQCNGWVNADAVEYRREHPTP